MRSWPKEGCASPSRVKSSRSSSVWVLCRVIMTLGVPAACSLARRWGAAVLLCVCVASGRSWTPTGLGCGEGGGWAGEPRSSGPRPASPGRPLPPGSASRAPAPQQRADPRPGLGPAGGCALLPSLRGTQGRESGPCFP